MKHKGDEEYSVMKENMRTSNNCQSSSFSSVSSLPWMKANKGAPSSVAVASVSAGLFDKLSSGFKHPQGESSEKNQLVDEAPVSTASQGLSSFQSYSSIFDDLF